MQIFGCLIFLLLGLLLFVGVALLLVVAKVLSFFGIDLPWFKIIKPGAFHSTRFQNPGKGNYGQQAQNNSYLQGEQTDKQKIYTEDDGEYVDFEEVKD